MFSHVIDTDTYTGDRDWFNRVRGPVTNLGIAFLPSGLTLTLAMPIYP